eukprot:COSAG02_NODE_49463_length_326_cov_1.396476_1_plen_72_part_10
MARHAFAFAYALLVHMRTQSDMRVSPLWSMPSSSSRVRVPLLICCVLGLTEGLARTSYQFPEGAFTEFSSLW